MNQSLNIQHPSDLHWTSENWELQSASGCPAVGIEGSNRHQFSYPGVNRSVVEWDWDNQQQMLLAQNMAASAAHSHSSIDDGDRKLHLVTPAPMKPYGLMQPSTYGSFPPQGQLMFGSSHHGNVTSSSNLQGFGVQVENGAMSTPAPIPFASVGGGVVSVNSSFGDLRSFEQRRRLFGLLEMDPRNFGESVKREELFAEANARIGLNLGVRTYFSTEDTLSRLGKRPRANSPGAPVPLCQAEGCKADLSAAKHYHRRHKVCELHSKAATVIANGQTQRFCQQCSRFHPLGEFDEGKRSCRKRLADHNRRRRKPQPTASAAASEATGNKENETDASQEVATTTATGEKPSGSPTTSSQEHSDSKTGSGDSLQLRASCTSSASANKSEDSNSGAHSTLLGDRPDTQALLPALSPSVSLLQNQQNLKSTEESSSFERLAKGANLTLASSSGSSGGNGNDGQSMVSWLKPLELSSPSAQQKPQLLGFTESRSGQSTPMSVASSCSSSPQVASSPTLVPVQSSRAPSAAAEWIFTNVGSGKRTSFDTNMGTFHGEIDGQQIFGLLDNPLTAAAQQEHQQQQQEDPNLMGHLIQS